MDQSRETRQTQAPMLALEFGFVDMKVNGME